MKKKEEFIERNTFVEQGRRGGNSTKKKLGVDHFKKIGKLGAKNKWKSQKDI